MNFGNHDSSLSIFGNATRAAGRHQTPTPYTRWHPPILRAEQDSSVVPLILVSALVILILAKQ